MTSLPNPAKVSAKATVPSWTARTGAPSAAAISMPFDEPAPRCRPTAPNRWRTGPGDRPVEVAAERAGSATTVGSAAAAPPAIAASRRLQPLLRAQQLAGELRVQVAPPIDVVDEGFALVRRRDRRAAWARSAPARSAASCARPVRSSCVREAAS